MHASSSLATNAAGAFSAAVVSTFRWTCQMSLISGVAWRVRKTVAVPPYFAPLWITATVGAIALTSAALLLGSQP